MEERVTYLEEMVKRLSSQIEAEITDRLNLDRELSELEQIIINKSSSELRVALIMWMGKRRMSALRNHLDKN